MPDLRKRKEALLSELRTIESNVADQQTFLRMADNIEGFLERLRCTADNLDVLDRKKILRLVLKEILVFKDTIKIKHSIPITAPPRTPDASGTEKGLSKSYLLRSWSHTPPCGLPSTTSLNLSPIITPLWRNSRTRPKMLPSTIRFRNPPSIRS